MDSTLLQLALPYKDDNLINWSIKFMKISRTNNSDDTATTYDRVYVCNNGESLRFATKQKPNQTKKI